MPISGTVGYMFEYQSPATLNQPTPVQNTYYPVLNATNCRVYGVTVNIEDASETLDIRVTIDGYVSTPYIKACTHSTIYEVYPYRDAINLVVGYGMENTKDIAENRAFLLEGRSVLIELRKTTVAGTGNLTAIADYGILKPI